MHEICLDSKKRKLLTTNTFTSNATRYEFKIFGRIQSPKELGAAYHSFTVDIRIEPPCQAREKVQEYIRENCMLPASKAPLDGYFSNRDINYAIFKFPPPPAKLANLQNTLLKIKFGVSANTRVTLTIRAAQPNNLQSAVTIFY